MCLSVLDLMQFAKIERGNWFVKLVKDNVFLTENLAGVFQQENAATHMNSLQMAFPHFQRGVGTLLTKFSA